MPRWMPGTSLESCQSLPRWRVRDLRIAVLPRVSTVVDANSRCLRRWKMAVGSAGEALPAPSCIGRQTANRVVCAYVSHALRPDPSTRACGWLRLDNSRHYGLTGFLHSLAGRRCRCHRTRHARQRIKDPPPTVLPWRNEAAAPTPEVVDSVHQSRPPALRFVLHSTERSVLQPLANQGSLRGIQSDASVVPPILLEWRLDAMQASNGHHPPGSNGGPESGRLRESPVGIRGRLLFVPLLESLLARFASTANSRCADSTIE